MLQASEPGPPLLATPIRRLLAHYALAFGAIGVALLLDLQFSALQSHRYAPFLFAIIAVAFIGGFGPSLVATVLAIAATNYFEYAAEGQLRLHGDDLMQLSIFVTIALCISFLTTKRRHAEGQLERANAELRQLDHAKDQFIATVSHELRTPMTVILGWAEILRQESDDNLRRTAATAINQSARAQARLIDDLLDMSRLNLGKMHLEIAPVGLLSVVQQAAEMIRPEAQAKGISIRVILPRDPCIVQGDSLRLQQICWNLLSNAVKFTPAGGRIDVRLVRDDRMAEISVSDTGDGISKESLSRIFEAFRQGSGAAAKGGLGLGLAIVRHLATIHGGTVEAHSDGVAKGARFIVRLPLATVAAE